MARVDAYVNGPADYEEIPDMSGGDPADGVFQRAGVPKLGRRPIGTEPKQAISLRLDRATLESFKASGPGWQTKMGMLLASNGDVLKMIRQNVDLLRHLEEMLAYIRNDRSQELAEAVEQMIAQVERDSFDVAETTNSLRDQLGTS